jgi:Ser/Thr protein kinase RdoA (MazF antagonist)
VTLFQAWDVPVPAEVRRPERGTNNEVEDGQVSGILDCEITGLDLRAVELAAALLQCTGTPEQVAAFRSGYGSLSPAEEDAMPTLILYRALGSAVWRAGHWRTGHSPIDMVSERLALVRDLDKGATPKTCVGIMQG